MTLRQLRMQKVPSLVANHPNLFHHPPRTKIRRHRKRDQIWQLESLESVTNNRARSLRSQPPTPCRIRKPPPNLNHLSRMWLQSLRRRQHKSRIEARNSQPDVPNKRASLAQLRRELAKPMRTKVSLNPICQPVRFRTAER